ncbi:MAG: hypothetical protein FJ102_26070 [Deltaproteobacteria bacterium]|nr:hypothetical protein [Deltaproteobacteria bacterium]
MSSLGFHLVLRLGDDRVIAPSRAARRRWASQLCALARTFEIVAWKLADTHMHIVLRASEAEAHELVRRLRIWVALALSPGVPLEVQRLKPLAGQSHLEAAFHYALRQDDHHGVETDTYQDSSSVLDVLGLRVHAPEMPRRVREALPRLRREALLQYLSIDTLAEAVYPEHLAEAAAGAWAVESLRGRDALAVAARQAAVGAARDIGPVATARALGITPQAACRLAKAIADPREVRAVRLQMAFRAARPLGASFEAEPRAALPAYASKPSMYASARA